MNRDDAIPFLLNEAVDNAMAFRKVTDRPENARLVGWIKDGKPVFVATWSYLGNRLDDDEAIELAADYLAEKKFFQDGTITPPDYVL